LAGVFKLETRPNRLAKQSFKNKALLVQRTNKLSRGGKAIMQKLATALIVLTFSIFAPPANAALIGFLDDETGTSFEATWLIGVTNTGAAAAMDVKIDSFMLTQTSGAACTPTVTLPGALGTIAAGATALASVTIDFSGCLMPKNYPSMPPPPPGAPLFTLDAAFSADGLTGSLVLTNLAPIYDGTVYPAAVPTPEPSTWALTLLGFGLLGAMSAARGRLKLPRSAHA
jgi:PEP-CTERM motif